MTKQKMDRTNPSLALLSANLTPGIAESRRHFSTRNPFTFLKRRSEPLPMEPAGICTVQSSGGQSLIARRPKSQKLAPLKISARRRTTGGAAITWEHRDERESSDVVQEGRELFSNFVYQQAESENSEALEKLGILTPAGHTNAKLAMIGRELRHIAQTLVDSPHRQRVRRKAAQVNPNITFSGFRSLLKGLFAESGVTREAIVVLFFFCSDVALNSLTSRGEEACSRFLEWSLSFISQSVCAWVQNHGGWAKVIKTGMSALSLSLAVAGVILLGFGFIKYVTRA